MTDRQRHGLVLLLVAGLVAASVVVMTQFKTYLGLDLKGGVELVYHAEGTPQAPHPTQATIQQAVDIMQNRVNQLGVSQPSIETQSGNDIDAQLPAVKNVQQAENEVGTTARLVFYDWEANALVPVPKSASNPTGAATVASQLPIDTTGPASSISQGDGQLAGPGSSSTLAGAMGFYQAVKFASTQPAETSNAHQQRLGPEYYLFGAPGSSQCAALAAATGKKPATGVHCLISGPIDPGAGHTTSFDQAQLYQGVPSDERGAGTQVLVVQQGTVVLQGSPANFQHWPTFGSPSASYYVLRDSAALFGNQINKPLASTDQDGSPDVTFGFTGNGASKFQNVTRTIAQRGQQLSIGSQSLEQHFAIALNNQLVTVPQIDYHEFPDGIPSGQGSEITGGFTSSSASQLATELRLGALPVKLVPISESQVSATLGSQALHQGLIAGLAGLLVVALFLLVFYRVLGVIAIGGLVVYGIYFYGLIKLIPITLTLAGIAGLILTIGVAADANIVIFERVKEEIRAGRSIRQGIVTGYRKGLTAIIDANVVTVITAFILFVLSTADVKGFAFTLGIGTFVSLFTAVLATQAILMTLGDSRSLRSASALGAGKPKRRWTFDFMGASRYFFSMSGIILLVGALAIGGRGLNLGIDFTSGSQIQVGLQRPATVNQVRSVLKTVGAGDAQIQKLSGKGARQTVGPYGFQIDSKYLKQAAYSKLRTELSSDFGIRSNSAGNQDYNTTSVGPSFGSSVTKSAVIAIVISLLVITLYVALRFDWKFAIPVLIALAHDLLITSGVYALTGRVVTTDTVAALLTILGYSLYDTIIVFDRVRENVPRMPRAAFSQIVNRSMSEVLTRSLATTSCTLLPIIALLIFGGSTLKDFAFALLIGVASGAYSSIFIASPVLTHWKEREVGYRHRRERIEGELGYVPAYAEGGDVEPGRKQPRRTGSLTAPDPENVSNAEFEQMKRDLGLEEERAGTRTSTLTQRLAHHREDELATGPSGGRRRTGGGGGNGAAQPGAPRPGASRGGPGPRPGSARPAPGRPPAQRQDPGGGNGDAEEFRQAPDIAENEGMVAREPKKPKRPRNKRHGRR